MSATLGHGLVNTLLQSHNPRMKLHMFVNVGFLARLYMRLDVYTCTIIAVLIYTVYVESCQTIGAQAGFMGHVGNPSLVLGRKFMNWCC